MSGAVPAEEPISGSYGDCQSTIPNGRSAPGQPAGPESQGGRGLWTVMPADGILEASRPQHTWAELQPDGWIRAKFPWFGGRRAHDRLRITAKRFGSSTARIRTSINRGSSSTTPHFWASYLFFPSTGCWRVSARSGAAHVSFVLSVVAVS